MQHRFPAKILQIKGLRTRFQHYFFFPLLFKDQLLFLPQTLCRVRQIYKYNFILCIEYFFFFFFCKAHARGKAQFYYHMTFKKNLRYFLDFELCFFLIQLRDEGTQAALETDSEQSNESQNNMATIISSQTIQKTADTILVRTNSESLTTLQGRECLKMYFN